MNPGPASFWLQVVVALLSGGTGLLVTLLLRKLENVSQDVKGIAAKVGEHAEKLAAGAAEMREQSRRLAELERKLERIDTNGCAHAKACLSAQD